MKKHLILLGFCSLFFLFKAQDWYSLPIFPGVERDDASGFIIGNNLYVGSGLSPWWSPMADFFALNLSTNQFGLKSFKVIKL